MKEIWLIDSGDNWDEVKENLKNAIELGFTGVALKKEFFDKAKKLGKIELEEPNIIRIKDALDVNKIISESDVRERIFIDFENWRIIPLENLIAMKKKAKIIPVVDDLDDARVMLQTLEKGADGIAVPPKNRDDLMKFKSLVEESETLDLKEATITEIKILGMGDRVCVDTISLMSVGEGMLVGNTAEMMFLVASESEESEYVASRPFRVNAGSVNAYIKVGDKTRYLSELRAGDEVEIVRYDGKTRKSYVGRVKIEKRPMILIKAKINGIEGSIILQNAETIKLVNREGKHVSVTDLKEGDKVLVYIGEKARHFGVKVEESIIEG
uniref:3-dehydroquinate synthase n=1 Tax=Geoglobus ahangari TaxID=113653 RepID=A0A7C4WD06_9EURY